MFSKYSRFSVIFIATSLIMFSVSCTKKKSAAEKLPQVIVSTPITEDLSGITSVVGQVIALEQVNLKARVSGFMTKRNFEPGQFVTKGQLLFEIQKDQYEAEVLSKSGLLKEAQAQLDFLKIEYNRAKLLYSQNAISQQKFQLSEAALLEQEGKLDAAKANFELATLNLSYTDVLSPFNGRIGAYEYGVGNMVDLNSKPLAVVTQTDPIWVEFNYSEALLTNILLKYKNVLPSESDNNYAKVKENVNVNLILSNSAEYSHPGKIDFIDNTINANTGTIQLRALFPNPDQILIPGGYTQVKLSTSDKVPCLLVPQSALQEDQVGIYLFIVNDQNIVEQKYVKLGMVQGSNVVIAEGIDKNELIITQGILRVRPGVKVNYKKIADSKAVSIDKERAHDKAKQDTSHPADTKTITDSPAAQARN